MRVLVFVLFLMIASPALAFDWTMCGGGAVTTSQVRAGQCKEIIYDNSGGATMTKTFYLNARVGDVQFDSDIDAASTDSVVMLGVCIAGYPASDNTCEDVLSLTGAGTTTRQKTSITQGFYRLEATGIDATDRPIIQVQGRS